MSQPIKFFNCSFKHLSVHDVDDSCDDSNQFKDGSPYPFIDDNIKASVQGKPIGEQGDEGFLDIPSTFPNQEKSYPSPSNPRLDGGRSKLTLPMKYIFSDRPA